MVLYVLLQSKHTYYLAEPMQIDLCHTDRSSGSVHTAAGASRHECEPDGHTIPYASPEVLTVKLKEITGEGETVEDYEVDSLAAEQWSAGVVLCQILIQQLPFESAVPLALECPAHLDSEACFHWVAHHETLQAMQPWVRHLLLLMPLLLLSCVSMLKSHLSHMNSRLAFFSLAIHWARACRGHACTNRCAAARI